MEQLNKELESANDWEGYIWKIEDKRPLVFRVEAISEVEKLHANPQQKKNCFDGVQEALLYSGKAQKSLMVKNIDGKEMLFIHRHEDFENENFKVGKMESFPGYAESVIKKLKFKQVYELRKSQVGEPFEFYQPVFKLFVGLEK